MTIVDATTSQITAAEAARAKAIVERDLPVLEALTADDYTHVEASGVLRDKAGFLEALRRGTHRFSRYDTTDLVVQRYGDVAIVRGILENSFVQPSGAERPKRARFMRVYVLQDGAWRNVSHMATEIPPAAP